MKAPDAGSAPPSLTMAMSSKATLPLATKGDEDDEGLEVIVADIADVDGEGVNVKVIEVEGESVTVAECVGDAVTVADCVGDADTERGVALRDALLEELGVSDGGKGIGFIVTRPCPDPTQGFATPAM